MFWFVGQSGILKLTNVFFTDIITELDVNCQSLCALPGLVEIVTTHNVHHPIDPPHFITYLFFKVERVDILENIFYRIGMIELTGTNFFPNSEWEDILNLEMIFITKLG